MSRVEELIAGFKAQFASKLIAAIAGAFLIAALARLLQPQGYGTFMLALTIFSIFELIARLGIANSAGRYIAEFKEKQPGQIPHIVRFSLLFNLGAIALTSLVVLVSYEYIIAILGEPELAPFLIVGTVLLIIGTVETYLIKVLQGFEAIRFIAILKMANPISRVVFALGLVVAGFGAIGAYVGYIISAILTVMLGAGYLVFRLRNVGGGNPPMESGLRRRIAEYAIPLTATNSASILDKRVDTLLVGFFLSPIEVGFYVLSDRVVKFLETPMDALGFTISPMFGSEKAAGNIDQISRIYETTLVNSMLIYIPAAAGVVLVAEPLITLVFGTEYTGAAIILQVLSLFIIFKAITKQTDNGLNYLGRARDRAIYKGITAVLNVILNIILIPIFGVVGAAIATVITYGLYTASNLYIVSLELELRPAYLTKQILLITLITGVMSAVVFTVNGYISGWITLFLVVGTGVLVWLVLSIASGMLDIREVVSTFG